MAALKKNKLIEWFWAIHPRLYRWSGGRLGGEVVGMPVLLLTTTGRKSGRKRTKALTYLPHGDQFVVIASYLGEPNHPAWWHNLKADPAASVNVKGRLIAVHGRQAEGAERDALWAQAVAANADYAEYAQRTSRTIPVIVLSPL